MPNFSTLLFDNTASLETHNRFDLLSSLTNLESPYQISVPPPPLQPKEAKVKAAKATLNNLLRILIMNCQSVKNKKAELHTVIDSAKPDIIIGNESWLTLDIKNSEIFPDSFDAVRKERASNADSGVFITFKRDLLCTETLEMDTNCETVWCKMYIIGCRTLHIGSFYRPLTRLITIILRSLTHPYLALCRIETPMLWLKEISIAAI